MSRDVRLGDRIFRRVTEAAGLFVLVTIAAIAVFLVAKAVPAFRSQGLHFFTRKDWFPDPSAGVKAHFGIAALAFGTVLAAVLALVIVIPVALGAALAVTELAPKRLGTWLGYLIDLLAAVPSVVYGLWAFFFLIPRMEGLERWLARYLDFIPLFSNPSHSFGKSVFAASVVLA
ncbi:MAG: phosphate ABC transporter permease subunit PstC, partial [Actinobacteria bacterium]|nr:phosphate ABC transporter permease subunit PstC [Actinomycetota bacterium]